ncbi:hypothetical protein KOW79_004069 [Hemibagrus wyckioides]|uniref:Transmembrane protein n=1 Tax=Hemibagrus wyckioides TaxID=337641 RepID=A0A9D3P3D1_9TELE|nr:hypothetical protein KOW79_004069 [Hemibagrus wyckioides]
MRLHNVYSVGGFVVICLFAALVLLMLCNFLADLNCSCRKPTTQENIRKVAPPKRSQTVYSSMLPPRKDFVLDMDVVMNEVHTQTSGQTVMEMPEESRVNVGKKPLKIRKIYRAKWRKAKHSRHL